MTTTNKAKIKIERTKKGFSAIICFDSGKIMSVDKSFNIPEDANGKEAEVERKDDLIIKIVIDGVSYGKSQSILNQKSNNGKLNNHNDNNIWKMEYQDKNNSNIPPEATAPYNFIVYRYVVNFKKVNFFIVYIFN